MVRRELYALFHLNILFVANLSLRFLSYFFMTDASPIGGALVKTLSTQEEMIEESRWCGRGGFYTVRDVDLAAVHGDQTARLQVVQDAGEMLRRDRQQRCDRALAGRQQNGAGPSIAGRRESLSRAISQQVGHHAFGGRPQGQCLDVMHQAV